MEHLKMENTKYTVKVDFNVDTGVLLLEGASYPENASEFYQPILDWIKQYTTEVKKELELNLKLNYLNTSSTKCMLDIIDLLEEFFNEGGIINIKWYYEENDEDILETGIEFSEDTNVPIKLIAFKNELQ